MNPKLDEMLETHLFEPEDLKNDRFAESFVNRGEKLLGLIGNAMGKNLGNGRDFFEEHLSLHMNQASTQYTMKGMKTRELSIERCQ